MSDYERKALEAIRAWKTPRLTWFGMAMECIDWPLAKAFDAATANDQIKKVINNSLSGSLKAVNDLALWAVRHDAIFEEYRRSGHDITSHKDLYSLDLEVIDKIIGWLGAKYNSAAFIEGGATGAVGLLGIPADIVALLTLCQRAVGEYATYCGFDVANQSERLFALNVLALASSPTDGAKYIALAQLIKIAEQVARRKTWQTLEEQAFVKIIKMITTSIGIRLTKAKLAQVIPIVGAGVGAGFNAYYINKVCDAAFFLYRERFLAEKYGPEVIEKTVMPANNLEPTYETE
jgi:hypothetical protein